MATTFAGIPIEPDRAGIAQRIIETVYELATEAFQNGLDPVGIMRARHETYDQIINEHEQIE